MHHLVDASRWVVAQADSAGILFLNGRKVRLERQQVKVVVV